MDLFLIAFLAVVILLACLALGLSVVGFGRVQLLAGAVYFTAFAVLLYAVTHLPTLTSSASTADEVDRMLLQSDRLFFASEAAFNVSIVAFLVFVVSGAVRIWARRTLLFSRISQLAPPHHDHGAQANSQPSQKKNPLRYLAILPIVIWSIYDFCYNDRGLAYYSKHPHMLLYALVTAVIMVGVLVCIWLYSTRQVTPRSRTLPQ